MMNATNYVITEPAELYHSQAGRYMSSHLLADFRESPALYHKKVSGEVEETDSPALALGRATHCIILEGRTEFDRQYVVSDGPCNPKTGEPFGKATKAYAQWRAEQDREVISNRDYSFILKLQASVGVHPTAPDLLIDGIAEGVLRAEYCGVECQIRMDWFSNTHGLVDLKTCDSLRWFESDCKKFGYVHQMAFYRAIIKAVTGWEAPVHIIAVEKHEPFSTGVWKLSDHALDLADQENRATLERYGICQDTDQWPTGYENERIIDFI